MLCPAYGMRAVQAARSGKDAMTIKYGVLNEDSRETEKREVIDPASCNNF